MSKALKYIGAVKCLKKWLPFPLLSPSGLSVNIKATAGCSVLIKQLSVQKQLINNGYPPPLPQCVCLSFTFYDQAILHCSIPWIAAGVYYAHDGWSDQHNVTIVSRSFPSPATVSVISHTRPRGQLSYLGQWLCTRKQETAPLSLLMTMTAQSFCSLTLPVQLSVLLWCNQWCTAVLRSLPERSEKRCVQQ